MVADGDYTAVLDRFERDQAVLVLEQAGESVDEFVVDPMALPEAAREQDAVLKVTIGDDTLTEAVFQPEETERRREAAQRRFDQLSQRPPSRADEDDYSVEE